MSRMSKLRRQLRKRLLKGEGTVDKEETRCILCGDRTFPEIDHLCPYGPLFGKKNNRGALDVEIVTPPTQPYGYHVSPSQATSPQQPSFPSLQTGDWSGKGYGSASALSHNHGDWFSVGQWMVGGMSSRSKTSRKPMSADIEVYLDRTWLDDGDILTSYRSRVGRIAKDVVYVVWADMNAIPLEKYKTLVHYLAARVRAGDRVAIGCIGGHGRTGTVLAGIIKMIEGISGTRAIAEVRQRYCDRAVETAAQEKLVKRL